MDGLISKSASAPHGAGPETIPAPGAGASPEGARAAPRPSVMSLSIKEKGALYAAYMRFIDGGGLFIPTTRSAHLGDDVYAIVTLMDDPTKVPIRGKICWVTPAGVPGRPQGIGVQFAKNEAGELARNSIETLLSGVLKSTRPTHTI